MGIIKNCSWLYVRGGSVHFQPISILRWEFLTLRMNNVNLNRKQFYILKWIYTQDLIRIDPYQSKLNQFLPYFGYEFKLDISDWFMDLANLNLVEVHCALILTVHCFFTNDWPSCSIFLFIYYCVFILFYWKYLYKRILKRKKKS